MRLNDSCLFKRSEFASRLFDRVCSLSTVFETSIDKVEAACLGIETSASRARSLVLITWDAYCNRHHSSCAQYSKIYTSANQYMAFVMIEVALI